MSLTISFFIFAQEILKSQKLFIYLFLLQMLPIIELELSLHQGWEQSHLTWDVFSVDIFTWASPLCPLTLKSGTKYFLIQNSTNAFILHVCIRVKWIVP